MDTYQQLISKAHRKRNKAIREARAEYRQTVKEIDSLLNSLGIWKQPLTCNPAMKFMLEQEDQSLEGKTVIEAAETVLRDLQPLTVVEITIAIQNRGCRSLDDPRKVASAIEASFRYHCDRFHRDAEKRWVLEAPARDLNRT